MGTGPLDAGDRPLRYRLPFCPFPALKNSIIAQMAMSASKDPVLPNRERVASVELDLMLVAMRMVMAAAEQRDVFWSFK